MLGEDFNLRHLRAFAAVCDQGGISAASDLVHLSQPAITQAISKLERLFETRLFQRSSKGMFPTEAALVLLGRTHRAFDFLASVTDLPGRRERVDPGFLSLVTSTQLRALIAVAAHGNFSVAARALAIAQPSLHRAARDLEALASQVFYLKSAKGIELTPAAEALARAAKLAFSELDQAIEEIAEVNGKKAGTLRIGSLPLSLSAILPDALNEITAQRPALRVSVMDAPFAELLYALRNGEIDILLGALRDPDPAPDVVQEPLFDDRLCVVCRPGHPLLTEREPDLDRLAAYPWVVARGKTPTRAHFDRFFASVQSLERGPAVESNSLVMVRRILQGSNKLSMISLNQAREHLEAGTLGRVAIDLRDSPRRIGLTHRQNWQPTRAQSAFLEIIRKVAKSLPDDQAL